MKDYWTCPSCGTDYGTGDICEDPACQKLNADARAREIQDEIIDERAREIQEGILGSEFIGEY